MTPRHVAALTPPLGRLLPRLRLAAAAAAAAALVTLSSSAATGLQLAALALATAIGSALEDPAAATIAATPVRRRARRALTLALGLSLVATTWGALVLLAGVDRAWALALTIQLAGLAAIVLALAAVPSVPASVAGPAIVLTFATARLVIPQWTLTSGPHDPRWQTAQLLWAAIAATAGLTLAWLSRDAAAVNAWRSRGRPATAPAGPARRRFALGETEADGAGGPRRASPPLPGRTRCRRARRALARARE
jgi:MFS family permease